MAVSSHWRTSARTNPSRCRKLQGVWETTSPFSFSHYSLKLIELPYLYMRVISVARLPIKIDTDSICRMYADGLSIERIAAKVDACPETVRKRLRDAGVPRRPAYCPKSDANRPFCTNGHRLHEANRYVTKKGRIVCRQCRNDQAKQQYKRIRQYQIQCIKNNPELQAAKLLRQRLQRVGLTISEYQAQFEQQGGLCALCEQPEIEVVRGKVRLLAVDHDHVTGEKRGLLCRRCNCILGMFNDDPVLFQKAIEYLSRWRKIPDD